MEPQTADRIFVLQKLSELEKSLSSLKVDDKSDNNSIDLFKSINEIKDRFSANSKNNSEKDESENEKRMERRLSQIADKDMDALMNDILKQNQEFEEQNNQDEKENKIKDDEKERDDRDDTKSDDGNNSSNSELKENDNDNDNDINILNDMIINGISNDIKFSSLNKHNKHNKHNKNSQATFDCIIAMAGGLKDDGSVHPWVSSRLDLVYETYKTSLDPKPTIICTGGGTYHKPEIRGKDGWVIHESTSLARYLIKKGVNSNDIIREWGSYDTIASVYFTLVTCVIPRQFENISIITSTFHMPRVKLLFKWICGLHQKELGLNCQLTFLEASDGESDEETINARNKREQNSCQSLEKLMNKLNTKEIFHKWLFEEHKAYSCNFINQERDPLPETLKKSY